MKKYIKKIAAVTMTGVMALGLMTGCSNKVDGTKTVLTVNDEALTAGTMNFMLRYQQAQTAQMYEMYFGGVTDLWDTVADEETGETYGEQQVDDIKDQMIDMMLLKQHGADYDISVSDEEKTKIEEAAKSFMDANDEATLATLSVTQSDVEAALELSYYQEKMHDPMVADVDTEVSDEEAAQTGITYIEVTKDAAEDVEDSSEDASEEEATEDEAADETEAADPQATAQSILEQVVATADADMDAIAKAVDENLSALTTHYTTNPAEEEADVEEEEEYASTDTVPQELKDAAAGLKDGEVAANLIETDDAYYILRLDAAFDEEATEDEKETIANDRQEEEYNNLLETWKEEATIEENESVLKTITVRDNDKYSFKEVETDSSEDSSLDSGVDSGEVLEGADAEASTVDEAVDAVDEALSGETTGETTEEITEETTEATETPAE